MQTEEHPEALRLALDLEALDLDGSAAAVRRMHAELETLRTGYDAARLEIESLQRRVQEVGAAARREHGLAAAPTSQPAPQQEAQEPVKLSDAQIKAHGDKASRMMARNLTRFDAACEVDKYLREQGAPGYYRHRMSIVLFGNDEGTEAARAPDTDPQPSPASQGDAFKLLDEVAQCFTTDDGLPDNLLPRIDAVIAARAAQEGKSHDN